MAAMSKRANLWTLIAAHLVCTALGLWMQQQYLFEELKKARVSPTVAGSARAPETGTSLLTPSMLGIEAITFVWTNGLLGMIVYMVVTRVHDEFARRGGQPAVEALRRTTDLLRTQDAVIFGLAKLADSRDSDTGEHLERIALYSSALATALRRRAVHRDVVTPAFVEYLGTSSALHDIGKVGIEDSILRKPGALTPDERRRIQEHTRIGEDCLREIERRLGSSNFLRTAREIAASHHERWDGGGYPARLKGKEIPLAARIVAVADVYDALSTKRVYKNALPHAECVEIIRREAGKHFDPLLVETFLEVERVFENIARRLGAPHEAVPDQILRAVDHNLESLASGQSEAAMQKEVTSCCGTSSAESAIS
jgi:HD-GYP domain-containing protein (c-di-GMP phosphodiesterase class II)